MLGVRVLERVRQRLLHDPVGGEIDRRRQRPRRSLDSSATVEAGRAHLLDERVEPRRARAAARTRASSCRIPSTRRRSASAERAASSIARIGSRARARLHLEDVVGGGRLHDDHAQRVRDDVVQLARDARLLLGGGAAAPPLLAPARAAPPSPRSRGRTRAASRCCRRAARPRRGTRRARRGRRTASSRWRRARPSTAATDATPTSRAPRARRDGRRACRARPPSGNGSSHAPTATDRERDGRHDDDDRERAAAAARAAAASRATPRTIRRRACAVARRAPTVSHERAARRAPTSTSSGWRRSQFQIIRASRYPAAAGLGVAADEQHRGDRDRERACSRRRAPSPGPGRGCARRA